MELYNIIIILVCLWALTNLWLLPLTKDRWQNGDLRHKIARAGTLVVLEKVRDLSMTGTVAMAIVILLVWIAAALSGISYAAPKAVLEALASVYHDVKGWAETYGSTVGITSLVGAMIALYFSARRAKMRIAHSWIAKANEIRARLQQDPEEIDKAEQDPDLQPLVQRLKELISVLAQHDHGEDAPSPTTEGLEALKQDLSSVLSALAIEMAKKELVFDAAVATPAADETRVPPTVMQRVLRALATERFCKDVGLMRKPLSFAVSGLLVVSLIGWSAEPLANSLQLTVNNLRVNLFEEDATRAFNESISKRASSAEEDAQEDASTPNTAAVQTVSRALARAITSGMMRSGIVDHIATGERAALSKSEFVRAAINEKTIDVSGRTDSVSRVRKEVAQGMMHNHHNAPVMMRVAEHIEREVAPHIERVRRESPGLFTQLAHKLEARYSGPLSPLNAQETILANVLDEALGGIDRHPKSELGRQGQKLLKEFGTKAVETWANAYAKAYVTDMIVGSARHDVLARMGNEYRFEVSRDASQFAKDLQTAEGHGWASAAEKNDAKTSRAVAEKVAGHYSGDRAVQDVVRERLGGYNHLFPPAAAEYIPEVGGGGGGGGGGGVGSGQQRGNSSQKTGRAYTQARATNFHVASRSFRVRGVLIGRDQQSDGADVKDLRWTITPGSAGNPTHVTIEIQIDGQWVSLNTFDAAIVNQALRYAADRRVIATTITPGDGKIIGRVTYLHPALVDTPLGCRVVEADRFVDTFSFGSSEKPVAPPLAQLASDRHEVGRWIDTVNIAEKVAAIPSDEECPQGEINDLVKQLELGAVTFSPALEDSLERFFAAQETKSPGTTSLLRNAHACATGATETVAACLCNRVKKSGLPNTYWFPEDHTSQFRENEVMLGRDLLWMGRSADHLSHIDLWVHTTFALRDNTDVGYASNGDESTATAVDFPSEQLALLKNVIAGILRHYLAERLHSPSYDDFMKPLEDFVVLQRFMRAALAGDLGHDFPLTKLVELERDTQSYVPYQRTIRWEPTDKSEESLVATLKEADPEAANAYVTWRMEQSDRFMSQKPTCDRASQ